MADEELGDMMQIEWLDSCSHDGWHRDGDIAYEPSVCCTVGRLAHEDARSITLIQSTTSDGQRAGAMTIPRQCILTRTRLVGQSG